MVCSRQYIAGRRHNRDKNRWLINSYMQGSLTESSIGQPTILISNGKQHSLEDWATATADEIFNTCELNGEKLITALMVKAKIRAVLIRFFDEAIQSEKLDLEFWENHCATDINPVWNAIDAMNEIQIIQSHEWYSVLKSVDWSEAALFTIGTHFASAMHVERLNFCDEHPDNKAAQAYKLKYQG